MRKRPERPTAPAFLFSGLAPYAASGNTAFTWPVPDEVK